MILATRKSEFFYVWDRTSLYQSTSGTISFLEPNGALHKIAGPLLHFKEYLAQIEAKHPEEKQLKPQAQDKQCSQGEPTRHKVRLAKQQQDAHRQKIEEGEHHDDRAKIEWQLQPEGGKRENAVGGQSHRLPQCVTTVTSKSRGTFKRQFGLLEADVRNLSTKELEMLSHGIQCIHALPIQQSKICASRH